MQYNFPVSLPQCVYVSKPKTLGGMREGESTSRQCRGWSSIHIIIYHSPVCQHIGMSANVLCQQKQKPYRIKKQVITVNIIKPVCLQETKLSRQLQEFAGEMFKITPSLWTSLCSVCRNTALPSHMQRHAFNVTIRKCCMPSATVKYVSPNVEMLNRKNSVPLDITLHSLCHTVNLINL